VIRFSYVSSSDSQVTGINLITFYSPVLFQTLGFGQNAALYSAVILGVIGIVCTIIAAFLLDKLGRRVLFLYGGTTMLFFMVGVKASAH
jgi:MFS family permease